MKRKLLPLIAAITLGACSDQFGEMLQPQGSQPISLMASIQQQNTTRANEQGFVTGDRMGIYVVDRVGAEPGILGASDNRATNMIYTFDGETYRWA